uniref:Uncharacterized protein n=1 Tax=Arundo donax TaxID=35708 RepID=A0A0A8Y887_ARUDO
MTNQIEQLHVLTHCSNRHS